ncbi:hypothetical protein NB525_11995 [Vibrio alginolyticus]|uniref:hypothetical protein n=1 Tax=Vibrio TaxID=662 RepID=UPI000AFE45BB|nr:MULTISPECIES: hypothetical protein [Vibrio]MCR9453774.1 hypothetical protein [Vibrio alginolyticus]MCR9462373.1 hypothetical protein [Vibrio alginolyticus]MCR9466153.1 hypothetical protein [Vibrio alginolyticus]MCR9479404.1 hypothetical protein [Vibrio alginolyticus]MCR9520207.1 hypothetical protein [Vibrio alginolyticus]
MIINYALSTAPYSDDVESCINVMTASMFALDKESGAETEVATCDFYIVDLARASNITNCHDLLDVDGSIYHFVQVLDDNYLLKASIEERNVEMRWGVCPEPDRLIVIHELKVKKEHRGNKYSKALIEDFIARFTSIYDIIGLKAFPLEDRSEESVETLKGYYSKIGFKDVDIDDLMLWPTLEEPDWEEILSETDHLMSSPKNAEHLEQSIEQYRENELRS